MEEELITEGSGEETAAKGALEEASEEEMVQEGVHNYSTADRYVWPTDPKVLKKLEWFQDQNLGLMMHRGH